MPSTEIRCEEGAAAADCASVASEEGVAEQMIDPEEFHSGPHCSEDEGIFCVSQCFIINLQRPKLLLNSHSPSTERTR